MGFFIEWAFGEMNAEDKWLFKDMLNNSSSTFLTWAMDAVLKWDNKVLLPNMYHITGDKDMIFNHKKMKDATIIKGGTHIMIFDKAKQINKILKAILKKK
jgi:hypothetical protein